MDVDNKRTARDIIQGKILITVKEYFSIFARTLTQLGIKLLLKLSKLKAATKFIVFPYFLTKAS
jgi:hypothetical protein